MSFIPPPLPGKVQCIFCETPDTALHALQQSNEYGRMLLCRWTHLPATEQIFADVLSTLADAAQGLWPHWYAQQFGEFGALSVVENRRLCAELEKTLPQLCVPWLKVAIVRCQQGLAPNCGDFSRALQTAQLALTLHPQRVVLVFSVADPSPLPYHLLGLTHAALKLATETHAGIALVLPTALAGHPELDGISYAAHHLKSPTTSPEPEETSDCLSPPIAGQPHPFSPGEQLLANKLANDSELAGLFACNQHIQTCRDSHYWVDFLWHDGKIVLEVDGYRYHSPKMQFNLDRHRDYELLISGFLVLRLPHDAVMEDVELTLEKIRDVVNFRQQQYGK